MSEAIHFLSIFHAVHWLNPGSLPRMGGHERQRKKMSPKTSPYIPFALLQAGVNLKPGFFSNDARLIEMTEFIRISCFASARRIKAHIVRCTTSATGLRHQNSRLCHILILPESTASMILSDYHQGGRIARHRCLPKRSPVLIASRLSFSKTTGCNRRRRNASSMISKWILDICGRKMIV